MSDWSNIKPMVRSGKAVKPEDCAQFVEHNGEYIDGRLYGPIVSVAYVWFEIVTKEGRKVSIPRVCLDYDPVKQEFVGNKCPYRKSGKGRIQQIYFSNFLVRDLEENQPRRPRPPRATEKRRQELLTGSGFKAYIKDPKSKTFTPWRLLRLPASFAEKVASLKDLNKVRKNGKTTTYSVSDPKYGIDISVKYDEDAPGTAKYDVQKGERTRVTEKELKFPMQPLELEAFKPMTRRQAERDWEELKQVLVTKKGDKKKSRDSDDDDDDDDDGGRRRRRSKNRDRDRDRGRSRDRDDRKSKSSKSKKEKRRERNSDRGSSKSKRGSGKKRRSLDDDIPF